MYNKRFDAVISDNALYIFGTTIYDTSALFSDGEFISFLIYYDGVWNEINLYATVVFCLSRFTLAQHSGAWSA